MRLKALLLLILLSTPFCTHSQESRKKPEFNIGIKAGFHALTYNDPEFNIDGYKFDKNCIHSNKIGYTITPFARITYKSFYIQSEATFGVTYHSFDFNDSERNSDGDFVPNNTEYNLRTYSAQVPILIGYNFVDRSKFGMSVFTGPRTKFIFSSHSRQEFKHFNDTTLEEVLYKKVYYWEIGLGVKIDKVFFDFVYDIGLSDASKLIKSNATGKTFNSSRRDNVLSFSVGMIF